jgi:hypothetical protein
MEKAWVPDIIKEEKVILERTFNVRARLIPKQIYKVKSGIIKGEWEIRISKKKMFIKMIRQMGFKQGGEREE